MEPSPTRPDGGRVRSTLAGIGIAILGIVVATLTVLPVAFVDPAVADPEQTADRAATIASLVLNFVGFFLAGGLYLSYTDRGWSFVDLRWPTAREWKYVFGGAVVSILFYIAVASLMAFLDIEGSSNQVVNMIGEDRVLLLAFMVIIFVANAPAEEFLFRNVIQKRLYEGFSRPGAIVVSSLIFASIHFSSYLSGDAPISATIASLVVVFGASLLFGYLYAKTDNLLVPTAAHAAYNGFQAVMLYVAIEYGEGIESAATVILDLETLTIVPF